MTAAIAEERLTRRELHIMPRLSRDSAIVNPFSSLSAWVLRANDDGTYPERHIRLGADGSGYSYCEHQQRRSSLLGPAAPRPDLVEALSAYHVSDYAVTARGNVPYVSSNRAASQHGPVIKSRPMRLRSSRDV